MEAKEVLRLFLWVDLDGGVAERVGQLLAYLITKGKPIEYQDIVIAASFIKSHSDYLITLNKQHFIVFPKIAAQVYEPKEFLEKVFRK